MNAQATDELQAFHRFLTDKLSQGGARPSPEEVLEEWRDLNPDPAIDEAEVAAIQEAFTDMANGDRGQPVEEVLKDIRAELGLSK
jgi:hypothetical protein